MKDFKAKLSMNNLVPLVITFIVAGLVMSYGIDVSNSTQDDFGTDACGDRTDSFTSYNATVKQCQNSTGSLTEVGTGAFNASGDSISGVGNVSSRMVTYGTLLGAVLLIGLLIRGFGGFARN